MENQSSSQHAIKWGVIIGATFGILTLLIYVINETTLASMWLGLSFFALSAALVIYAGMNYRNGIGGYINFKGAYLHSLITFIIAGFVGLMFNVLLYKIIDPELVNVIADGAIENAEAMMEKFGMPEDKMDEALEKAEEDIRNGFSTSGLLKNFASSLFVYAILALITGAIVKRNEPEM